jgi:ABC-type microcin C transport system permease subunit YejB
MQLSLSVLELVILIFCAGLCVMVIHLIAVRTFASKGRVEQVAADLKSTRDHLQLLDSAYQRAVGTLTEASDSLKEARQQTGDVLAAMDARLSRGMETIALLQGRMEGKKRPRQLPSTTSPDGSSS